MATFTYNQFKARFLSGEIDFENDTIKCALVTASYTPDRDTHTSWNHVTSEVSGAGYTAGGKVISPITLKAEYWYVEVNMPMLTWRDSTITNMRGAVIYKSVPDTSQSWLICYIDTITDKSTINMDFFFQMRPLIWIM